MGLFNFFKKEEKKTSNSDDIRVANYSKHYVTGTMDISIEGAHPDFDFKDMPYAKYDDDTFNSYMLFGLNRDIFMQYILFVLSIAYPQRNIDFSQTFFEPTPILVTDGFDDMKSQYLTNPDFNHIEDTRFTPTGKISKNAYMLRFFSRGIQDSTRNGAEVLCGVSINKDGKINSAYAHLLLKTKTIRKKLKMIDNRLEVVSETIDGRSTLNT